MIIRNLELTVNDDRATLNEEVVIYLGDNGICLHVALKQVKYKFNTQMVCSFEAIEYCDSCEVIIQKPNEEIFIIPKTEVINNLVHVYIDSTWTDTLSELGEHRMQIILYDKDSSRITLPSVAITVLRPLLFDTGTDILTEDGIDLLNENRASGIRISELEETSIGNGYIPIVVGGKTRKYELDVNSFAEVEHSHEEYLVEADIENFVTQSELEEAIGNVDIDGSLYATKDELTTGLSSKADKEHTHDYATESFVKNEIAKAQLSGEGEIDLSGFATKDELDAKADKEHTHEQYLTEHQDISHLVSEDELTTELSSKADTTHTHSEYLTEHQSLNHLATKTELTTGLSNKADTGHTHSQYLTEHQDISHLANKEHTHTGMLISSTIFKIEVVDELPTIQETGTLYIVKSKEEKIYPYGDCDTVVTYQPSMYENENTIRLYKIDYSKPSYINGVEIESTNGEYIEYTLDNSIEFITLKLINLKPISDVVGGYNRPCVTSIEQMRIPNLEDLSKLFYSSAFIRDDINSYSWQPQYFEFHPNPTNMAYMFDLCLYLTDDMMNQFMLYFPSTSSVTDMTNMFGACQSLTSLDLSNFNTNLVTNMSGMFGACSSLTSLNISNFNTSKVNHMGGMFGGCRGLTSLDLSNFNTNLVTHMGGMFYNCESLTSLNISSFNTSKVEYMGAMFQYCSSLTSLDLSSFNTSNATDMASMFEDCISLTSLDLSNFNTSKVEYMCWMFRNCSSLTSLDLSNFNTSKVTRMDGMFQGCTSLTSLDLSNFNTSKVTDTTSMFNGVSDCTIYIGDGWTLDTTSNAYGGTNLTFIRV